ncbi:predicted protein [Naegleria gruberi]|uniref:MMS19 nucleotide excision repair protein n=1 Tax=Naegleria gruberi TaxID=5762 RepID=D2VAU3_NAEGR|nr:uncharacterized protein NAEGRDRAFT_65978 [Naegleria gruberi]EFC46140.1 predicted protein [Naegleria gruberi]|eukprot:XP_002678884.1 predicted protein [Naegleria gruberi strain NEG-M]
MQTSSNSNGEQELISLIDSLCNPTLPNTNKESLKSKLIEFVVNGTLTINEGIKLLGEYLNHATDDRIRGAAYAVLDLILENIPNNVGSETDETKQTTQLKLVASLLRFIGDRFYDFDCLATLLPCLFSLFKKWSSYISSEQAINVVLQFFENVNIQSIGSTSGVAHATKTRSLCFEWFSLLADRFPSIVRTIDFLNGFIQSLEGERDPGNLLYCFNLIPKVIAIFDDSELSSKILSAVSDDLFDITSCYFPITYTPPANDTRGITREDLSRSLKLCFGCNKFFAPTLFPFLLEKLSSDLVDTKLETLDYLCYCIEKFGEVNSREYLTEIWSYIKAESVKTNSMDVMKKCYESITKIARIVIIPNDPSNKPFDIPNIEAILRTALLELKSKEPKFAAQYARMIYACAVPTFEISMMVFNRVMPELVATLSESDTKDKLYGSLLMITQLLQAVAEQKGENQLPEVVFNLISQVQTVFLSIYEEEFSKNDKEMILVMVETISRIAIFRIPSTLLRDIYVSRILLKSYGEENKSFSLLHATSLEEYKERVIKDIAWIYKYAPDIVSEDILVPLFGALYGCENKSEHINRILSNISAVGKVCPSMTPSITHRLFERIESIPISESHYEHERVKVFETITSLDVSLIPAHDKVSYIQRIVKMSVTDSSSQMVDDSDTMDCSDSECAHVHHNQGNFSFLTLLLGRSLENELQQVVLDSVLQYANSVPSTGLKNFISVLSAIVIACRPTVGMGNLITMTDSLLQMALKGEQPSQVTKCIAQLVGSVLNKLPLDSTEFQQLITICNATVFDAFSQMLTVYNGDSESAERYIEMVSWILKGLVMRGAYVPHADRYSSLLCGSLVFEYNSSKVNKKVAEGFLIAIGEDETSIHKENHAIIQVLYKQRFFATNVRKLMDSINTVTQPHIIGSILLALSNLIHNVPTKVILSEVKNIFPIVLKFLEMRQILIEQDNNSEDLLYAAIKTTLTLLSDAKEEMSVHLSSIVPILLDTCKFKKSQAVRILSVEALLELTNGYKYYEIYPLKKDIIKGLEACLDDKKRKVRKAAVKCRNSYFVLSNNQ